MISLIIIVYHFSTEKTKQKHIFLKVVEDFGARGDYCQNEKNVI